MLQTTELWAEVEGPHYQFTGLDFLLLAITSDGLVAESIPVDKAEEQKNYVITETAPLSVHVSVAESLLQATVSWELPQGHQSRDYQVRWGREDCDCETPVGVEQDTMYQFMESHQVGIIFNSSIRPVYYKGTLLDVIIYVLLLVYIK